MRLSRSLPATSETKAADRSGQLARVLASLCWLLPAAIGAYALARGHNADQFAYFRYARIALSAIADQTPVLLNLQLGMRLFPDLPISLIAYMMAFGDPTLWATFFPLINLILLFVSLLLLARGFAAAPDHAWLFAALAMLLILAVAGQNKYMLVNTFATPFHNTLLPFCLAFYALPFLLEGSHPWVRRIGLACAIAAFGLVIQSNKLFLVWCVVPYVGSMMLLCAARVLPWRGLVTIGIVTTGAIALGTLLDLAMTEVPFVVSRESSLFNRMLTVEIGRRIDALAGAYRFIGGSTLLALYGGALTLAAAAWWFAGRRDAASRPGIGLLATTLVVTAVVVPLAILVTGRASWRYLFYVPFLPLVLAAWSLSLLLGRLPHTKVPLLPLVALLTLGLTLPPFVAKLRAAVPDPAGIRQLMATLEQLHHRGAIGPAGLSSYWVAHNRLVMQSDFFIGSIWPRGVPYPIASNQLDYWRWTGECLAPRQFTFVVSGRRHPYRLAAEKLSRRFGAPGEVVQVPGSIFEVWLYPQSIEHADQFYLKLEALTERQGKLLPPRCVDQGGAQPGA